MPQTYIISIKPTGLTPLENWTVSPECDYTNVQTTDTTQFRRGLFKFLQLVFGYTILSGCNSLFQLLLAYAILSKCFPVLQSLLEQGIVFLTAGLRLKLIPNSGGEMAGMRRHTEMEQETSSRQSVDFTPRPNEELTIDDSDMNKFHRDQTVGMAIRISNGPTPFHSDLNQTAPATANIFENTRLPTPHHIRLLRRRAGPSSNSMVFDLVCLPIHEAFGHFVAVSYCWGTEGPSKWLPLSDGQYIHVTATVELLLTHIFHTHPEFSASADDEGDLRIGPESECLVGAWTSREVEVVIKDSESDDNESNLDDSPGEDSDSNSESDCSPSFSDTLANIHVDEEEAEEGNTAAQDSIYIDPREEEGEVESMQGNDHDDNDEDRTFFQHFFMQLGREVETGKRMDTETFLHGCLKLRGASGSPWWQRVWVIQEVASSRSIQFHYGRLTFSIGFLYNLFKVVGSCHANWLFQDGYIDDLPPGSVTPRINKAMSFAILSKIWVAVNLDAESESLPLGRLWAWLSSYKATDPRDRIFALLNLADGDTYGRCLLPDYNSDTRDVFIHAMEAVTSNTPDFTCLGFAGLAFCRADYYDAGKKKHNPLPSWVPDFAANPLFTNWSANVGFYKSSTLRRPILARKGAICRSRSDQEDGYEDFQHGVSCPAQSQKKQRCPFEHYETLTVYSVMIDTITYCGPEFPQYPGAWSTLASGLEFLDDGLHIIHRLGTYPTREEPEEVLARALYANNAGSSMAPMTPDRKFERTFRNFLRALRREVTIGNGDDALHKFPALDRLGAYRSALPPTRAGCGRKLFSTRRGYIGLALNGVRVEDEVRLINGAGVPFITRRCLAEVEGGGSVVRQLVCEAYVHGIMNGEASTFDDVDEGLLVLV